MKQSNRHSRGLLPGISTACKSARGVDPRLHISGMTSNFKEEALNKNAFRAPLRSGFTLIELLVVVLIIAVLAAIALPQYQHAINKVRYISMMETVNAAKRSQELYYLTHGSYATSFEDLKADLPGNCSGSSKHYNCGNFSLYLDSAHHVYALPHKEPMTTYITYYDHSYNAGKRACGIAHSSQPERAKKLCRAVTGKDSEGFYFFF